MSTQYYDIVVIGGGIQGVGVAQAGVAAGYSVALLEQSELAYGTSSRSSKLIHGGLRYLESAQFALVRECLQERKILLKIAPHLVQLKPFFIPVFQQTRRRPLLLKLGLSLYACLAGLDKSARFKTVARHRWMSLDGLNQQNLQTVLQYWDAQTDDAALTRAVMHSAQQLGADLMMPATFEQATYADDRWQVLVNESHETRQINARVLVNATGPWVNITLKKIHSPTDSISSPIEMALVQGTHIVLPGNIQQGIYYVEAPQDGRAIFVMPKENQILVGTTETRFQGDDPTTVKPLASEIEYLLTTFLHYFPGFDFTVEDVVKSYAGLRVLPHGDGHAFSRPRETILHRDCPEKPRLLSIYGGKLTAYRHTASCVIAALRRTLPNDVTARADTRLLMLS